ncbi:hypothetical protein ACWD3K_35450 [Streptomyces sp. NPDC002778]
MAEFSSTGDQTTAIKPELKMRIKPRSADRISRQSFRIIIASTLGGAALVLFGTTSAHAGTPESADLTTSVISTEEVHDWG